jgi:3-dehydroquinate dehydratase-2
MTHVLVLNGPNLGRLGSREPDVYGAQDLATLTEILNSDAEAMSHTLATLEPVRVSLRQTDDEGELIRWLHEAADRRTPVILNPAAFSHYSYGLRDAAAMVTTAGLPLVEVHITNPHTRETFRHNSVISGVATGVIAGFGFDSYRLALRSIIGL